MYKHPIRSVDFDASVYAFGQFTVYKYILCLQYIAFTYTSLA